MRRRGFTVIEMLVVLAALALLLSVAAPAYVRHLDKARDAALVANLSAMRQAIDQYQADRGRNPRSMLDLVQSGYLRQVPVDPVTQRTDTWVLLQDAEGGMTDIRSGAAGMSRDGVPYANQ